MPSPSTDQPAFEKRPLLTDPALCLNAVVTNGLDLRFVAEHLKTDALCRMACQRNGGALAYVPAHLKTRELCLLAARHGTQLHSIPATLWNDELIAVLVRHNGHAFSSLPPHLQTDSAVAAALNAGHISGVELHLQNPNVALLAIEEDFRACARVPGYLFTQAVFDKAEALYLQDPQWPSLVAQRRPRLLIGDTTPTLGSDTFKAIWACYLNEELCIAALYAGDALYRMPRHLLTRRVCEAAFALDSFNLTWIPPAFITPAMCERAVQTEYGQLLSVVPEHLVTAALCLSAVQANENALACVPEAFCTLPMYVAAVKAHSGTIAQVPEAMRRDVYTHLIVEDADNAPYYFSKRATEASLQGDFAQAAADCDEVIRHRPQLAEGYFQRADALHTLGQWPQAFIDVQTALALQESLPWANNLLGVLLECGGMPEDLPDAIHAYTREIKHHPTAIKPLLNRAELLLKLGNGSRANDDIELALYLSPNDDRARYLRGYLGYEAGDIEASQADYRAAVKANPAAQYQGYADFSPAATSCVALSTDTLGIPRTSAQWEAAIQQRPALIKRLPNALRTAAMYALALKLDPTLMPDMPLALKPPQPKPKNKSWTEQALDESLHTGKRLHYWGRMYDIIKVFATLGWRRKER